MKLRKICVALFLVLLLSFAMADDERPEADAGDTIYDGIFGVPITISGECTDEDDIGTSEGTLNKCDWNIHSGSCTKIGEQQRTIIEDNYNTADFTVSCRWTGSDTSRWATLWLTAEDETTKRDRDSMRLRISKPDDVYNFDFGSFDPEIDFGNAEATDFSHDNIIAVILNHGASVEDFDFILSGSGETRYPNAAVKVEITDRDGDVVSSSLVWDNLLSGRTISDPISIFFPNSLGHDQYYYLDVYYDRVSQISAPSIDYAYVQYYAHADNSPNWVRVIHQYLVTVGQSVEFYCDAYTFTSNKSFSEDVGSTTYNASPANITAQGNRLIVNGFNPLTARCVNGAAESLNPVVRVLVFDAETGTPIGNENDYTNISGGVDSYSLGDSIVVPIDTPGIYTYSVEYKTCERMTEEGAHSWNAFLNAYVGENVGTWTENASYTILVLDADDMELTATGNDTEFYFTPYDETHTATMNWNLYNNTFDTNPTSVNNSFGLELVDVDVVESGGPIVGTPLTPIFFTLEASENGIMISDIEVPLLLEETVRTFILTFTYDDPWGLSTIPAKTVQTEARITFIPPPGDVVSVSDIKIYPANKPNPTNILAKPKVETFDVEITMTNFSNTIVSPDVDLIFQNLITNQELTIPISSQRISILPNGRRTFRFTGIPLKNEDQFKTGTNYKVSADIGNPGVESIIINNEKQKTFSVILPKPRANIPEISPIIVLLIGLIVLGILKVKEIRK
ncbi:MAG: hypothetical protein CL943_01215 [Candidatus Diapherotrites archaeon]|uniref:Uncharacterized protein n=1 Tax=Candidatus Iainarchaeum sp. TaxID=3101447 RepID=A0A2D6M0H3_9ARCH|nr:hypothetical protein [Candidatus Diapherotrites archaeon]